MQVISKDGTAIGYDRVGQGPAVILVDAAMCYRKMGPSAALARLLAQHFTVFTYDRRGRGESGDAPGYNVAREIEDLDAVLQAAGGSAAVWGTSSGGVLALDAATLLAGIKKVAIYEAPLIVDASRPTTERDWQQIDQALEAGRRGDAANAFLRLVGVPGFVAAVIRLLPLWSKMKAIAPTLAYDGAIVRDLQRGKPLPAGRWTSLGARVLVMDGAKSPAWMKNGNRALADLLHAPYRSLPGQTHAVKAKAHAPALTEFFAARKEPALATF